MDSQLQTPHQIDLAMIYWPTEVPWPARSAASRRLRAAAAEVGVLLPGLSVRFVTGSATDSWRENFAKAFSEDLQASRKRFALLCKRGT